MILVLPVVFETEKLQMEQQQQLQQRQVRQESPAVCPGPAELAGSAFTSCWGRRVHCVVCCGSLIPPESPTGCSNWTILPIPSGGNAWQAQPGFSQLKFAVRGCIRCCGWALTLAVAAGTGLVLQSVTNSCGRGDSMARHLVSLKPLNELFSFQILLGPNTGLSGGMPGALPPLSGKI